MSNTRPGLTALLNRWCAGDSAVADELWRALATELRKVASSQLPRGHAGATVTPTVLVNDLYVRLQAMTGLQFESRARFFSLAARVCRGFVVDYARTRARRPEGQPRIAIETALLPHLNPPLLDALIADQLLSRLGQFDSRAERILELRFFGGLTREAIAEVLGVSVATVKRDEKAGLAWMAMEARGSVRDGRE